jgi:hypothetical protein
MLFIIAPYDQGGSAADPARMLALEILPVNDPRSKLPALSFYTVRPAFFFSFENSRIHRKWFFSEESRGRGVLRICGLFFVSLLFGT